MPSPLRPPRKSLPVRPAIEESCVPVANIFSARLPCTKMSTLAFLVRLSKSTACEESGEQAEVVHSHSDTAGNGPFPLRNAWGLSLRAREHRERPWRRPAGGGLRARGEAGTAKMCSAEFGDG